MKNDSKVLKNSSKKGALCSLLKQAWLLFRFMHKSENIYVYIADLSTLLLEINAALEAVTAFLGSFNKLKTGTTLAWGLQHFSKLFSCHLLDTSFSPTKCRINKVHPGFPSWVCYHYVHERVKLLPLGHEHANYKITVFPVGCKRSEFNFFCHQFLPLQFICLCVSYFPSSFSFYVLLIFNNKHQAIFSSWTERCICLLWFACRNGLMENVLDVKLKQEITSSSFQHRLPSSVTWSTGWLHKLLLPKDN